MFEIKSDLTFSHLWAILKVHCKNGSTDLYPQLINITQNSGESPGNFLFREIELKERLPSSSTEPVTEEQYSTDLIQRDFFKAVGKGLTNDKLKLVGMIGQLSGMS